MEFVIADDHPFSLVGTKQFVENLGHTVLGTATDGNQAFQLVKDIRPKILISDINMPELDGLALLEKIRLFGIKTKVVFLTSHNEMSIYKKASEYGVDGYLLKNFAQEELEQCINVIVNEGTYLSKRIQNDLVKDKVYLKDKVLSKLSFVEIKIFELVAKQKSTKEIAELLFMSYKSVEGYRSTIIEKLNLPKEKNSLLKFASSFTLES